MADTLQRTLHARETDPELGRLLDALEPWAAGEDPDSDDARLVHWARRDFEKSVRVPADLAAAAHARQGGRACRRGRRRSPPSDFSPLPRRARAPRRAAPRLRRAASRATSTPTTCCSTTSSPGLTTAELRPMFAELREALVPLVAATGDPEQPRNDGVFHGPFGVDAPARRGARAARRGRLRPRPLAPGPVAAPVRAEPRADRRPPDHQVRRARLRRRAVLRAARVRPRALRGLRRPGAGPHLARRAGLARRARVPEPAVGERRRPLAPVLRVAAAAAAAPVPGRLRRPRRRRRSTARSTRSSRR